MAIERVPVTVEKSASIKFELPSFGSGRKGISSNDRMFFTERLALLLETGIPLHTSLDTIASQSSGETLRRVATELREDVSAGLSFSQALERHPESFAPTYAYLVAAAEQGGFLPAVLQKLRDMDERRQELNSTMMSSLSYPVFLALFSVAVVLFVLIVVFPKFGDLFVTIHDRLPISTKFLMAVSDLLVHHWAPIGIGLLLSGLGFWRWSRHPQSAARIDRWLLGVPVLRDVIVELQLVQFLQMMGLSLANGVSLIDSLRACREIARSVSFRQFIGGLVTHVQEGRRLAVGFEESTLVPELVKQMVATGEESGNLAFVCTRVADFYEREWRRKLEVVSKIAEPTMLLVMGTIVGVLVASLILPIFKLSTAVH